MKRWKKIITEDIEPKPHDKQPILNSLKQQNQNLKRTYGTVLKIL